jgi:hypothetical protein
MPSDPFVALAYFGAALVVLALVGGAVEKYVAWRHRIRYRRLERLVERNMWRATGGAS